MTMGTKKQTTLVPVKDREPALDAWMRRAKARGMIVRVKPEVRSGYSKVWLAKAVRS